MRTNRLIINREDSRGLSEPGGRLPFMAPSKKLDPDALERAVHLQERVLSRDQAIACGVTPAALRHRIRPDGPWQRLLPGVYLTVTGTPSRRQLEIAALLYAGPKSILTGTAALRHHGLRVPETGRIAVLVPARQGRDSRSFVRVWPTTRMPSRVRTDRVIEYTMIARALSDAARELGEFRAVRALVADAVQQGHCRIEWLTEELGQVPRRHSGAFRQALSEVSDGIRSAAEGDLRDLISGAGLPAPMYNARLYAGQTLIAVADAWWPSAGVAVEVDSREWHLSPEDWERTLRRNAAMGTHGIVVLHFTPRQLREEAARVATDIRHALRSGEQRGPLGIRALPAAG